MHKVLGKIKKLKPKHIPLILFVGLLVWLLVKFGRKIWNMLSGLFGGVVNIVGGAASVGEAAGTLAKVIGAGVSRIASGVLPGTVTLDDWNSTDYWKQTGLANLGEYNLLLQFRDHLSYFKSLKSYASGSQRLNAVGEWVKNSFATRADFSFFEYMCINYYIDETGHMIQFDTWQKFVGLGLVTASGMMYADATDIAYVGSSQYDVNLKYYFSVVDSVLALPKE